MLAPPAAGPSPRGAGAAGWELPLPGHRNSTPNSRSSPAVGRRRRPHDGRHGDGGRYRGGVPGLRLGAVEERLTVELEEVPARPGPGAGARGGWCWCVVVGDLVSDWWAMDSSRCLVARAGTSGRCVDHTLHSPAPLVPVRVDLAPSGLLLQEAPLLLPLLLWRRRPTRRLPCLILSSLSGRRLLLPPGGQGL